MLWKVTKKKNSRKSETTAVCSSSLFGKHFSFLICFGRFHPQSKQKSSVTWGTFSGSVLFITSKIHSQLCSGKKGAIEKALPSFTCPALIKENNPACRIGDFHPRDLCCQCGNSMPVCAFNTPADFDLTANIHFWTFFPNLGVELASGYNSLSPLWLTLKKKKKREKNTTLRGQEEKVGNFFSLTTQGKFRL